MEEARKFFQKLREIPRYNDAETAELITRARKDPKSVEVLERRFGLNGYEPHTLEMISQVYGITRERVRQIQNKSLKTIRGCLRRKPHR